MEEVMGEKTGSGQCDRDYPTGCNKPAQNRIILEFTDGVLTMERCNTHCDEVLRQLKREGIEPKVEKI